MSGSREDAQKDVETARVADEESSDETKRSSKTEGSADSQSFAQAHDAFQTTLAKEDHDDYEIPDPPDGVFD